MTYDEWLNLSEDDKDELHLKKWNVYQREGVGFAFTAAGRLIIKSKLTVTDARIGIFHGGEFIIELCIPDAQEHLAPASLIERHEGFRVMYIPESRFHSRPTALVTFDEFLEGVRSILFESQGSKE